MPDQPQPTNQFAPCEPTDVGPRPRPFRYLNAVIPSETYEKVKTMARQSGLSLSEYVRQYLDEACVIMQPVRFEDLQIQEPKNLACRPPPKSLG